MKNNIICPECGAENEPDYIYCKNCGAMLTAGVPHNDEGKKSEEYRQNYENQDFTPGTADTLDGISSEEMGAFIGKKAYAILPKFSKMEMTGSKISWCWPPAVLGILFGPLGASLWFFYRKMYKIAIIFVAVGIILASANALLGGNTVDSEILEKYLNSNTVSTSQLFEEIISNMSPKNYFASAIEQISSLGSFLVSGLFGLWFYKNHSAKKIVKFRRSNVDPRYYKLGLAAVGGTSAGMLILGILIYIVSLNLASVVVNIF